MTNFVLSAQAQKWKKKKVPWKTLPTNIDRSLSACTFILTYPLIARVIGASKWFHNQFPPFSSALQELVNSRPVHSLTSSSHLFFCLLSSASFHCALQDGFGQTWWTGDMSIPRSLRLFMMVRRSSYCPIACWILAWISLLVAWSLYEVHSICSSTSFPWLLFFAALLWGSMIYKHTGRWIWQGSTSVTSRNWQKCSRHSKLFQPCQCCCRLCYPGCCCRLSYPGEYLRLGTLVSYNWAQVHEACDCLKLLSIYFAMMLKLYTVTGTLYSGRLLG